MTAKAFAFDVGDYVVYPKHGVGRVIELLEQEIAGMKLELYVLRSEKERMTLRVPVNKVEAIGMRKLSSDKTLREALDTLKGSPRSSAPCGRAVPRNMKPRSIRAIWSASRK
jgi:CarD family transcriptional regulator